MSDWQSPLALQWEGRGIYRELAGYKTFTLDIASSGDETGAPLLVVHGFPTSSFDFWAVIEALSEQRRVLLFDMIGFGLSAKPDQPYPLALQADVAQAFVAETGVTALALLTHDLGDTVGGELLARHAEGSWDVQITHRVVTNGSIYIEMAQLTVGQQMLLALPDERLPEGSGVDAAGLQASLAATFAPESPVDEEALGAAVEFVVHDEGQRLLPRTIRYIEERRRNQARFTGAIETHPSPLTVVWGTEDPIAVRAMASKLHWVRSDAELIWLDGIGHYPMVEAPEAFADAVVSALATS